MHQHNASSLEAASGDIHPGAATSNAPPLPNASREALEPCDNEPPRAREAFAHWLASGPKRTYLATGEAVGANRKTVEVWAAKWNWQGRLAEFHRLETERLAREIAEERRQETRTTLERLRDVERRALDGFEESLASPRPDAGMLRAGLEARRGIRELLGLDMPKGTSPSIAPEAENDGPLGTAEKRQRAFIGRVVGAMLHHFKVPHEQAEEHFGVLSGMVHKAGVAMQIWKDAEPAPESGQPALDEPEGSEE